MRTTDQIVSQEVICCISSLVGTLADGYGSVQNASRLRERGGDGAAGLSDLTEWAFELACPVDDWEAAAIQAGWRTCRHIHFGRAFCNDGVGVSEEEPWCVGSWRELCEDNDIAPYEREVFEHWIVSDWLADELAERGEKVDKDFAGMTVWARTASGQAIAIDGVIEDICADLNRESE